MQMQTALGGDREALRAPHLQRWQPVGIGFESADIWYPFKDGG